MAEGQSLTVARHRGVYGDPRPCGLDQIALPPAPMPARHGLRPLKAWRYVGVFSPDLMLCLGTVRIGRARQSFWAVWDRRRQVLLQRTRTGDGGLELAPGRASLRDREVAVDLSLREGAGIETVCPSGADYAWTRKQGAVAASGVVAVKDGPVYELDARAVIDDTAAYYERHTRWYWSAGVGTATDGRELAWNLVEGVNDPVSGSERTIWVDGHPTEAPPVAFSPDLDRVGELHFAAEASRERTENLLIIRSRYRQPFGTFSGVLPGGPTVAEGYGVMEEHDVWW
ncbi:MAG: DUF2804 family protein [Solirubrobacteraceae bacterium]